MTMTSYESARVQRLAAAAFRRLAQDVLQIRVSETESHLAVRGHTVESALQTLATKLEVRKPSHLAGHSRTVQEKLAIIETALDTTGGEDAIAAMLVPQAGPARDQVRRELVSSHRAGRELAPFVRVLVAADVATREHKARMARADELRRELESKGRLFRRFVRKLERRRSAAQVQVSVIVDESQRTHAQSELDRLFESVLMKGLRASRFCP